jgi:cell wall-associated NlpC family hydrolase
MFTFKQDWKMKGRHTAILLWGAAFLAFSICGYCGQPGAALKSAPRHKKIRHVTRNESRGGVKEYVVRRGDSLIKIARTYKTTPAALVAENGLKSNKIKAGQKIRIPGTAVAGIRKKAPASPAPVASKEQLTPPPIPEADGEAEQPLRIRLVKAGFQMLGVRYRLSGDSKRSGFDCSGLVKSLFSMFDIDLPRTSREQFMQGEKVDRSDLEIGDLVFFSSGGKTPTHVGVYVGNDKFLHAARQARQVVIGDLNKIWYTMRYLGARRVTDLWGDEPPPQSQAKD